MALAQLTDVLLEAAKEKRAVGAFNVSNMEMVIGAIKAAEDSKTAIILQIAQVRLKHSPFHLIAPLMVSAAQSAKVPVVVHLDHGQTAETVQKALDYGFTSVMFDGSLLPLEENIAQTNSILTIAKKYHADVEAELGVIGGSEDGSVQNKIRTTKPETVELFLKSTPVDALAVAIGNAHGHYKGVPHLSFDILEKITAITDVPLVLHGGSGISDADFQKCIDYGIQKINIATASFDAVIRGTQNYLAKTNIPNYFGLNEAVVEEVYNNIRHHITVFNNCK